MKVSGLDGKVVVVTGGAGGIGAATVEVFVRQNASVVIADIDGDRAAKLAATVAESGGSALGVGVDISDENSVAEMFGTVASTFGGLDVLHNNAFPQHLAHEDGPVAETPVEVWKGIMDAGLTGPFLCSRYAIPLLIERGGGSIVFTSSIQALYGDTGVSAYATSKTGLLSLTKSIATQYGRHGIRCNAVCPGHIPSPRVSPEKKARLVRQQLLARDGMPQDIGNMVAFLASDEGSFVTGQVIPVDGGTTAHTPAYAEGGALA
ncbi:SDR family oxidoreductase [Pseudonocardia ailaonensis]|uniref:SDR family oxidoreductase n=1 Tax=Pseudonocardia ailaonensis TaxID=367279 RepID=A0ABN2N9K2_9PSEU